MDGVDTVVNDSRENNKYEYLLNVCTMIVSKSSKLEKLPGRPGTF